MVGGQSYITLAKTVTDDEHQTVYSGGGGGVGGGGQSYITLAKTVTDNQHQTVYSGGDGGGGGGGQSYITLAKTVTDDEHQTVYSGGGGGGGGKQFCTAPVLTASPCTAIFFNFFLFINMYPSITISFSLSSPPPPSHLYI